MAKKTRFLGSPVVISRNVACFFVIIYNYNILSICCHVVYATMKIMLQPLYKMSRLVEKIGDNW